MRTASTHLKIPVIDFLCESIREGGTATQLGNLTDGASLIAKWQGAKGGH